VLFAATKNADQPLAVWRMVKKWTFDRSGVAGQSTLSLSEQAKMLVFISALLSATVMWLLAGGGHTA